MKQGNIARSGTGDLSPWAERIGRIGIWSAELRFGNAASRHEAAGELDSLGYGALWVPGGMGGDILSVMDGLLDATRHTRIASAIINIWKHEPMEIGQWWRGQSPERQRRLLVGLGVSHAPLIGAEYVKPIARMNSYIDALTAQGVPSQNLCVAAFGPNMLDLSRARSAGAHPYLVTPEHTAAARERLGDGPLLAPGQAVTFESDPHTAREIARKALSVYVRMPNYIASWQRLGFTRDEIDSSSNRLCDALVAWGGMTPIAQRVSAHLAAGADHVCVKVVRGAPGGQPTELLDDWRKLAAGLM